MERPRPWRPERYVPRWANCSHSRLMGLSNSPRWDPASCEAISPRPPRRCLHHPPPDQPGRLWRTACTPTPIPSRSSTSSMRPPSAPSARQNTFVPTAPRSSITVLAPAAVTDGPSENCTLVRPLCLPTPSHFCAECPEGLGADPYQSPERRRAAPGWVGGVECVAMIVWCSPRFVLRTMWCADASECRAERCQSRPWSRAAWTAALRSPVPSLR